MRTNLRPKGFTKQLERLRKQGADRVLVSVHNETSLRYVQRLVSEADIVRVETTSSSPFKYNLYMNDLIDRVTTGFVWCVDDDDVIADNAIAIIRRAVDIDTFYMFRVKYFGSLLPLHWHDAASLVTASEPSTPTISTCNFVVHHTWAKQVKWDDMNGADLRFAQGLMKLIPNISWTNEVIYHVETTGHGSAEPRVRYVYILLALLALAAIVYYFKPSLN